MNTLEQINSYIASQPETKRTDMEALHARILHLMPNCELWFLDGRDETGKVVSNPNIGYGRRTVYYADGTTKEFYQIGVAANTGGISVYIMGLADKKHLPDTYGSRIGKAKVTGYCIRFKALKEIDLDTLEAAILDGVR